MTKLNKMKLKLVVAIFVSLLIGVVAVFGSVKAYQNYSGSPKVVVEGDYIEAQLPENIQQDNILGASATDYSVRDNIDVNGNVEYNLRMDFIDASTTIVSIPDPFLTPTTTNEVVIYTDDNGVKYTGAPATVSMARLTVTGVATTTYTIDCGASAALQTTSTYALVSSGSISTSTAIRPIENNLTAALGGGVDGGTVAKVALTSAYPYFICKVNPQFADAFTNAGNTFTGNIMIKVSRTRY